MTKKVQSQMQASEIRFLRKIKQVTMFDKDYPTSRISQHRVATSANRYSVGLSLDGLAV